ncbi:hypothetical protein HKCCE2091_07310 [Rhodobacterales bacterium HKCCE2091]|nr:hypothetical protein [Rhodobacterales bacterium HKCCE2091]
MAVLCIAGAAVVAALALGYYSLTAFAVCAAFGLVLGIPAGIWLTHRMKRLDPGWPPERLRDA